MGRSSSKLLEIPNNPLEELQLEERKREQRKRKQEKQLKKIAKLQKKQAKKTKRKSKQSKDAEKQTSITTKHASGVTKRTNSLNSQSTSYEINKEEFNRQIEQQIQNHLDSDLCTFIMNQVALTLQFFGNYEKYVVREYWI